MKNIERKSRKKLNPILLFILLFSLFGCQINTTSNLESTIQNDLSSINSPVVDKELLITLCNDFNDIDESIYTSESFDVLKQYITIGLSLIADSNSTQIQIDECCTNLNMAYQMLTLLDKTVLQAYYNIYSLTKQNGYSNDSYENFILILEETELILSTSKNQTVIDQQIVNLKEGYLALETLDFSELVFLCNTYQKIDQSLYTVADFNQFNFILQQSISIINNYSLTQFLIDEQCIELEEAYFILTKSEDAETRFKNLFLTFIDEIPRIDIDTNGIPVTDKENYVPAKIEITDSKKYNLPLTDAGVRLRGNSTMGLPKHPYRIKFDKKTSLFGFSAVKDWTLIANYNDKSLIRNYTISMLGRSLSSMDFNPNVIFIDVYLNNSYQGLYGMQDQIESGKSRVDVEGYTLDVNGKITDIGFLLEADGRAGQNGEVAGRDYFTAGLPFVLKYPQYGDKGFENLDFYMQAFNFIKKYVNDAYNAAINIKNETTYQKFRELCDENSFIDYFLIQELSKNQDCNSNFVNRKLGDKLKMGPLWDFDLSLGNGSPGGGSEGSGSDPKGWSTIRINPWFSSIMKNDTVYENCRIRFMKMYNENIKFLINSIDDLYQNLYEGAVKNFNLWKQGSNFNYQNETNKVKNFYQERSDWMYEQLDKRLLKVK